MISLPVLIVATAILGAPADADLDNAVLDFTAKWCTPCQQMSPTVSKLERAGLPIHKVDFDQNRSLAKKYGVTHIPAFVLVVNGKAVKKLTGPQSEETLRDLCAQVPGSNASQPGSTQVKNSSRSPTSHASLTRAQSPPNRATGPGPITNQPFAATVRIRIRDPQGDDVGTGTIIFCGESRALILTCGHLFKRWRDQGSRLQIEVFEKGNGRVVMGTKIGVDLDGDVALVSIPADSVLPVCELAPRGTIPPKSTPLVSVGCNGGAPPTLEKHKVVAINRYQGAQNLECTGIPVQGRSGGGLFNATGQVVGVCMAEDPSFKDGMYAGLEPVYRLLEKNKLSHLFPQATESELIVGTLDEEEDAEEELDTKENPVRIAAADGDRDGIDSSEIETSRLIRKALANSKRGDLIVIIGEDDTESPLGRVLVIHDPDDDLRRTLAAGNQPPQVTAFHPDGITLDSGSPEKRSVKSGDTELVFPPAEATANTSFRRGKPMTLRAKSGTRTGSR